MKYPIGALRDKYLPALMITLLMMCAGSLRAQYTDVNGYGFGWQRGHFKQLLAIPKDTVRPVDSKLMEPHIAELNGFVYLWSTTLQRWQPANGGGGGIDTTSLSNRINARLRYVDTAGMLAGYMRKGEGGSSSMTDYAKLSDVVKYTDTLTLFAPFLRGKDTISLSSRIEAIRNTANTVNNTTYSNGLVKSTATNEVRALYHVPMWNANRIHNIYIDPAMVNGGVPYLDSSAGVIRWRKIENIPTSGGDSGAPINQVQADYTQTNTTAVDYIKNKPNVYVQQFVGTSTAQFNLTKVPTSLAYVRLWVNGHKVSNTCLSLTVAVIQVNTACTGYKIDPLDTIEIEYESTN